MKLRMDSAVEIYVKSQPHQAGTTTAAVSTAGTRRRSVITARSSTALSLLSFIGSPYFRQTCMHELFENSHTHTHRELCVIKEEGRKGISGEVEMNENGGVFIAAK